MIPQICGDFWAPPRLFGIHDTTPASIAGSLIASLFYATILNKPEAKICVLTILCRLEVGPHLANLVKGLRMMGVRMHYEIDGHVFPSATFCEEAAWERCTKGLPFERRVDVPRIYDQSRVRVQLESVAAREHREDLSNSPCKAGDVMTYDTSEDGEESCRSSADSGSCYEGCAPLLVQECPAVPVRWQPGVTVASERASLESNFSSVDGLSKRADSGVVCQEIGRLQALLTDILHVAEQ